MLNRLALVGFLGAALAPLFAQSYTITTLNLPPNVFTGAINNAGQVAGYYNVYGYSPAPVGFVYDTATGLYTTYNCPGTNPATLMVGINNPGSTAGGCASIINGKSESPAFVETNGQFALFSAPRSQITNFTALNDNNAAVGTTVNRQFENGGFLFQNGPFHTLRIPGGSNTRPTGINNAGVIAGYGSSANGVMVGFIYDGQKYTEVSYPGAVQTFFTGINNLGQIVGGALATGQPNFLKTASSPWCPRLRVRMVAALRESTISA
jgi:hypothetical protein